MRDPVGGWRIRNGAVTPAWDQPGWGSTSLPGPRKRQVARSSGMMARATVRVRVSRRAADPDDPQAVPVGHRIEDLDSKGFVLQFMHGAGVSEGTQ